VAGDARGTREDQETTAEDGPLSTQIRTIAWSAVALLALVVASPVADGAASQPGNETVASVEPTAVNEAAINERPLHPGDSVVAIVNDTAISSYDLRQRMALFEATSGVRPSEAQSKEIREQVLKQLETERLELLEAQKQKISVSSEDVDNAINNILKDNHLSMAQLTAMLDRYGVAMTSLRAQIAAQIAWSKTVEDQYGDEVKISPRDVNAEMARIAAGAHKPHFLVSEIFLAVDTPEQDAKVLKDAQNLESQIQQGAQFATVARQFSQTPTAADGGNMGIVVEGQMPSAELNAALAKLHPGEVSPPIRSTGGYYILYLRARQEPVGTKIPDAAQQKPEDPNAPIPLARLLLPIGSRPAPQLLKNAVRMAEVLRQHIEGCAHLQELISHVPGAQYYNLGDMRPSDMSTAMRTEVLNAGAGEPTQPFQDAAGIELIVRCDKAVPKILPFVMPTRDEVEQQLFEEQVGVMARRYLRDLRRDADIETR
jgi:peptidyl-prolyl cis-trans isomerase SurA